MVDLLHGCQGQLGGERSSYAHTLVGLVMESAHAQLHQAVVLALPVLYAAAIRLWRGKLPPSIVDILVGLVSNVFDSFNR